MLLFRGVSYVPEVPLTSIKKQELQSLYTEYALYGGYPKIVLTPEIERKERYLQQIIDTYVRKDIRDLANITDVNRFNNLLEVLAAQSGNLLNTSELSNTCDLSKPTVERYLFLLEQTYILKLVRPYSQNLRTEITKRPKIFFLDTGLMQMLWLKHLQKTILGPVFETSLFTELIKRYGPEPVTFWRTTDKQEIDFVIKRPEGALPVEAKIQFPRTHPQAFKHFWQNAQQAEPPYLLVGLTGTPVDSHMIYPWQLT
jgi:predicted AAA+ superfamily ATPase